jgi:threonine aldolase
MRFISAQFDALLSNNLWFRLADYSNRMAGLLAEKLKDIPDVKITKPVQANAVFVTIPPKYIPKLQEEYFFYIFNPAIHECRLMCTWDTTEEDIENFTALMKKMIR